MPSGKLVDGLDSPNDKFMIEEFDPTIAITVESEIDALVELASALSTRRMWIM